MESKDPAYKSFLVKAGLGLLFCLVGLYLAYLSNPRRFALSVAYDQYIYGYLMAGLVLTLVGVGVFLYAARDSISRLPPKLRREVNTGVGVGFALQCAGLLAATQWPDNPGTALTLMVPGVATFTWGTMKYALGKGLEAAYGLLGLLGVIGLVVLILLPELTASENGD